MQEANLQDHNAIEYRRNYLTEVIARLDLVSPMASLATEIPKEISKYALKEFPIDEPKRAFAQKVEFGPDRLATSRTEFTEWNFHGSKREKRLAFNPNAFFIVFKEYTTYEQLRDNFLGVSHQFFSRFDDAQPSRLGLRYINNISSNDGSPLDWSHLVNEDLLGLFSFNIPETQAVRIFHNLEFKYPEFNLRFQFGMHNPDYPAAIRQKIFILDFDAYLKGLVDINQIPDMLDKFHFAIQSLFERSISKRLREIMNAE